MAERKTLLETLECRQECPHGGRCGTQLERIRRQPSGNGQMPKDAKTCAATLIRLREKLASQNDSHQGNQAIRLTVKGARKIIFFGNGSMSLLSLNDGEIFAREKEVITKWPRGN